MDDHDDKQPLRQISLKRYVLALLLFWTAATAGSLGWNLHQQRQSILDLAGASAATIYEKDVLYRRWVSMKGGVYAPVSEETPVNVYLQVANRDVTTSGGLSLTLINPAYMTRQVNELARLGAYNFQGHITSLNPIRPANAPDAWEARALKTFERGEKEQRTIERLSGVEYFRLMRPFVTEKSCLKCHAAQGYRQGDIRGGISVSILMAPLRQVQYSRGMQLTLAHFFLWVIGFGAIGLVTRRLWAQTKRREEAEEAVRVLSITDELTGLHNRRGFLSLAEQQLKMAARNRRGMLLYFADLDGLKWINDTLGHEEGDRALREAAAVLRETFRTSDILARLGGDEYAALALETTKEHSSIFTARLQSLVNEKNLEAGRKYRLSISVGGVFYDPESPCSLDELISAADKRMYENKQGKKRGLASGASLADSAHLPSGSERR
ncbi:MAG TPA: diguanylate cyclase [Smithellaceae bacterium]|nr:diguanylate cyclase [Smithellaceae bacterium]